MSQLNLDDVQSAAQVIRSDVPITPLVRCQRLEEELALSARLYFKCENLHRSRSFKERGATFAVKQHAAAARSRGVITRSSGNFAQALALAGAREKVAVTVVMPTTAPRVKVLGAERFGATVVQQGTSHAEGLAAVREISQQSGLTFLPPFDHPDVMVGQGTLGLEVHEALPSVATFFAPVGGGGLMGGCALALKGLNPRICIIGVEPEGAGDFAASLRAGERRTCAGSPQSIADGLLAPEVGDTNWPILRSHVDRAVLVSDDAIVDAMCLIAQHLGMLVEPSGAVALAGLLNVVRAQRLEGDIVCVISGGNVDLPRFHELCGAVLFQP